MNYQNKNFSVRNGSVIDREADLLEEMRSLREEARTLRTQNEDLSAQLLQASIETGQSLLQDDANSLAVEMHGKDKDEVRNKTGNLLIYPIFSDNQIVARARNVQSKTSNVHWRNFIARYRETSWDFGENVKILKISSK